MNIAVDSESAMKQLGRQIGRAVSGGEVVELVGDIGAGKTTLTKGIAEGLGVVEPVQSPTFTISRVYGARDDLRLCHYDFYRLGEAGIMGDEIDEVMYDLRAVTVIEWAESVAGVLPEDRLRAEIVVVGEEQRLVALHPGGERSQKLVEALA